MLLEKKQRRELERRKGLARRTILQVIWLAISALVAVLLLRMLFAQGTLTMNLVYNKLLLPSWVPQWAVYAGMVLVIVMVMQFFFIFGYMLVSPEGRTRPGDASAYSREPDPLDQEYR
jgi:ABC-type sugar transport system permease subunit